MHDHRKLGRELDLFDTDPLIGAGLPYLRPGRRGRPARTGAVRLRARAQGRLPARLLAGAGQARAVPDLRPLRSLPGRHVPADGDGRRAGRPAAEPVPAPCGDLPVQGAQLPGTSAAAGRAWRDVPVRALRRAGRPDQSAVDPAERRAHLLHPGPGGSRSRRGAGDDQAGPPGDGYRAGPVPAVAGRAGDKYVGEREMWDRAAAVLADVLDSAAVPYDAEEGEAAFYGPKIDVQVADSAEREASLSTVQVDFYQPERFGLEYIGADGGRHRPVMVHRSVIGGAGAVAGTPDRRARRCVPALAGPRPASRAAGERGADRSGARSPERGHGPGPARGAGQRGQSRRAHPRASPGAVSGGDRCGRSQRGRGLAPPARRSEAAVDACGGSARRIGAQVRARSPSCGRTAWPAWLSATERTHRYCIRPSSRLATSALRAAGSACCNANVAAITRADGSRVASVTAAAVRSVPPAASRV